MKRICVYTFFLAVLATVLATAHAYGQAGVVRPKDIPTVIAKVDKLLRDAGRCQEQHDDLCTEHNLRAAKGLLNQIPKEDASDPEILERLLMVSSQLGSLQDAERVFADLPDTKKDEWLARMESMRASYGFIALEAEEAIRTKDPTFGLERVELVPQLGTPTAFPFNLVRRTAEEKILQAFRNRDLLTDPIQLPAGKYYLHLYLTKESGLNYREPHCVRSIDLEPTKTAVVSVTPGNIRPLGKDKKFLAVVGAAILAPLILGK